MPLLQFPAHRVGHGESRAEHEGLTVQHLARAQRNLHAVLRACVFLDDVAIHQQRVSSFFAPASPFAVAFSVLAVVAVGFSVRQIADTSFLENLQALGRRLRRAPRSLNARRHGKRVYY